MSVSIAIVEDHADLRETMKYSFEKKGLTVTICAEHGKDLFEKLSTAATLPEICLTDLRMPIMDGFVTIRELKRLYPTVKIIANSTDNDKFTIEKVMDCGADAFIAKRSHIDEYLIAIKTVLNLTD